MSREYYSFCPRPSLACSDQGGNSGEKPSTPKPSKDNDDQNDDQRDREMIRALMDAMINPPKSPKDK